jgi:hypothetical protein
VSLIDVTNSIYVSDNIDRIINYEKYYIESWDAFLESYEESNKNDKTDI